MKPDIDDLLKQVQERVKSSWQDVQDAANTTIRVEVAKGLAKAFLEQARPYEQNAELARLLDVGLIHKAAFIQKPPYLLQFYLRLLFAFAEAPRRILEIGVKGGGSTALWKALFPSATVIGLDIKLRRWLASTSDGVRYIESDQTDTARLRQLAEEYGPFDLVIDDGSHRSEDQEITLRALVRHVRPGGVFVIEDTHAAGGTFWGDFIASLGIRFRGGDKPDGAGAALAWDLSPRIDDLIISNRVIALRIGDKDHGPAS
ncbi:MAG: class I SAM-dependent methyltransferase [Acidobacteria bacterium]|nr:class I SAM-dependent methyltransferase [Acidobacteriota bacterium]